MEFLLFSKISFEIPDPIALIECYCYQNDFYSKYDLLEDRKIEDVNKLLVYFFLPAMSIYMKDKPLQIAATTIKNLQAVWQKQIGEAENIILIGICPNLEDRHIWDSISSSKAKIFYCGSETKFKAWQKEKNRQEVYIGKYFEDTIETILDLI